MELNDVMRTNVRVPGVHREPVPDDVLYVILDAARFAPPGATGRASGSSSSVIVLSPPARRSVQAADGRVHGPGVARGITMEHHRPEPRRSRRGRRCDAAVPFLDSLIDVPVLLVICVDLSLVASFDSNLDRVGVISGASIYPFVHKHPACRARRRLRWVITTRSQTVKRRPSNSLGCRAISRSRRTCHSAGRSSG